MVRWAPAPFAIDATRCHPASSTTGSAISKTQGSSNKAPISATSSHTSDEISERHSNPSTTGHDSGPNECRRPREVKRLPPDLHASNAKLRYGSGWWNPRGGRSVSTSGDGAVLKPPTRAGPPEGVIVLPHSH